jgi:hypothetical protein
MTNIDLVNGAINVYETEETPRTYFGAIGASGKFYPSGSISRGIGSVDLFENNSQDLVTGDYDGLAIDATSGSGVNATVNIYVDGDIYFVGVDSAGSGYAIGDTLTIDASLMGGTGSIILKVTSIQVDSLLIVIGGDDYQVPWANLTINGSAATSLTNAIQSLTTLFSSLGSPYKSYTAIYTQNGVTLGDPPSLVQILQNTIRPNITPTISYVSAGIFNIDFGGSYLTTDKTFAICNSWGDDSASPIPSSAFPTGDTNLRFGNDTEYDSSQYILVEVRVYN